MAIYLLGDYIFAYILEKKMCHKEYIGRYKDQRVYSYWDSGFVGPIYICETRTKKNHVFLYSSVKASQAMTDIKEVWIAIHKKSQPKIKFYVLGVRVWQVPTKHAIMSLLVFIRLTSQIRRDSVIHHALNKFVHGIKVQRKKL